jgi:predicted metal-dependent hydrolase
MVGVLVLRNHKILANLRADTITVETPTGEAVRLTVRISSRAHRISLRINPTGGGAVLVVPEGAPFKQAERFARDQVGWLAHNLARQPDRIAFEDGVTLSVLGRKLRIRHSPHQRRGVWVEPGQEVADAATDGETGPTDLCVSGEANHLSRRVTDWLKRQAREEISSRARAHARQLDKRIAKISIRDTSSRWGSCSSSGTLSFSWRLILAPESVLDYVCAHEAAHLVEMNHSPAFWLLVRDLVGNWEAERRWLKRNGTELHRYG